MMGLRVLLIGDGVAAGVWSSPSDTSASRAEVPAGRFVERLLMSATRSDRGRLLVAGATLDA
jgi:hypothetical protein